jgi:hypothetical protein
MFLPGRLYAPLARVDDDDWQRLLDRHRFWEAAGVRLDAEHEDIAFHILMHEGELAAVSKPSMSSHEFDAVQIPPGVFDDVGLCREVVAWAGMHEGNFGAGVTTKMGLYVIRSGGTLGFHVDGPVFLKGQRADLSDEVVQRGMIEAHASRRTILPLRFNPDDAFMLCAHRAPMLRGELFEFSNMLPHAYFNRGPAHAVLLVTTYLQEALLPQEMTYR